MGWVKENLHISWTSATGGHDCLGIPGIVHEVLLQDMGIQGHISKYSSIPDTYIILPDTLFRSSPIPLKVKVNIPIQQRKLFFLPLLLGYKEAPDDPMTVKTSSPRNQCAI